MASINSLLFWKPTAFVHYFYNGCHLKRKCLCGARPDNVIGQIWHVLTSTAHGIIMTCSYLIRKGSWVCFPLASTHFFVIIFRWWCKVCRSVRSFFKFNNVKMFSTVILTMFSSKINELNSVQSIEARPDHLIALPTIACR